MSDVAIKVENLSKLYQLGTKKSGSLRDSLADKLNLLTGKRSEVTQDFWALRELSLEIRKGEAVGIIGKNGAGKSTLLKILSRITEPTRGRIEIEGRVASLLEVGTGFHPELSGRENVFLNGTILGMTRREIKARFEEIVDFSGVEKFIDTPVKYYSSGMYVRLAFAVAAHLEPEILIIDEVLAVGDAEFQKKCLGKMNEVAGQGRTVLFVSHDMQAVSKLVTHCIYLENGKVIEKGEKNSVINKYLSAINKSKDKLVYVDSQTSDKPKIRKVRVNTSKPNNFQISSTPMSIEVDLAIPHQITKTCLTLRIKDNRGVACLDFSFFDTDFVCSSPGVYTLICKFPKLKLYMGKYSIDAFLAEPPGGEFFQTLENICPFEVLMFELSRGDWEWQPYNTVYLEEYDWDVKTAVFSNQE